MGETVDPSLWKHKFSFEAVPPRTTTSFEKHGITLQREMRVRKL